MTLYKKNSVNINLIILFNYFAIISVRIFFLNGMDILPNIFQQNNFNIKNLKYLM